MLDVVLSGAIRGYQRPSEVVANSRITFRTGNRGCTAGAAPYRSMCMAIRLANDRQHYCRDPRGYRTAVRSRNRKVPCRFLNGRSRGRFVEPVVTRRRDTTDRAVGAEQLRCQEMLALCCDASNQRVCDQLQNHVFAVIVADSRDTSYPVLVFLVPSSRVAGSETRSLSRTRRTGGRGSPTCRRRLSTAKP